MKLERATAWSLLPILTLSVLSIATVPVYYHSLGTELYALWFAIQTMTGTFGFMDLGLGVATGRYVGVALGRGDFSGARETWASGNLLNLLLLALMAVVFGAVGAWWGAHWFSFPELAKPLFVQCVWWSALGLFFNYYGQGWQILLQAYLEFRWLSISRTIFSLVTGIGMAGCAWAFQSPLPCIIWGSVVAGLQLLVLMYRAQTKHHMGLLFPLARWIRLKEMGAYTAKTFLSLLSGAAFGSLDRWLLGRVAGSDSFVAYNIGSNLAARVQGLSVAAMGPIFHGSSRGVGEGDRGRLAEIYLQSFRMMFPLYFAGALWATVWQWPWLQLWLGPEAGARVATVLPFLLWGAALSALMNISGAQLGPLNLVGYGTLIQSGSWLLSGLLVWVGWAEAGLAGAGAGLMAGRSLLFLQDAKIRNLLGISVFDRGFFTRLLFMALLILVFWIISTMFPSRREISLSLSIANFLILAWLLLRLPLLPRKKD